MLESKTVPRFHLDENKLNNMMPRDGELELWEGSKKSVQERK